MMAINKSASTITREHRLALYILLILIAIYLTFWLVHPKPLIASDQGAYSEIAYSILKGTFYPGTSTHIFAHRIGLTGPVAAIYAIFGINTITVHLWVLISGIMAIIAVWLGTPGNIGRIYSALILALSPVQILGSIELLPDIAVSALMTVSVVLLYYRRKVISNRNLRFWYPALAVIFLFWAFLTKASAYWALLFWIVVFIRDVSLKRKSLLKSFYLPAIAMSLIVGIGYLYFCNIVWGSPWARLESLQALTGHHQWSLAGNWSAIKARLGWEVLRFLGDHFYLVPFLGIAGAVFHFKKYKFWSAYLIVLLLIWWLGSTSLSRYDPMPLIPRMAMPLLPAMAISGGLLIESLSVIKIRKLLGRYLRAAAIVIITVGLVLPMFKSANWRPFTGKDIELESMKILKKEIAKTDEPVLLFCSESRSSSFLRFYFGYELPQNFGIDYYGNLSFERHERFKKFYYYINTDRSWFLYKSYNVVVYDSLLDANGIKPALYSQGCIRLYKAPVPDWTALQSDSLSNR